MDCLTSMRSIDGATLVAVTVENPHDEPARFRLENALDGPVWPPRRRGYPEGGWDENGYEGVLSARGRVSLGYAVPADGANPPARIAWTEPAETAERSTQPRDAARTFRDPRPPRSVLSPPFGGPAAGQRTGDRP